VKEFRDGKVSKGKAILLITQELAKANPPELDQQGSTFANPLQSYINMLESHEQEICNAADRGRGRRGRSPSEEQSLHRGRSKCRRRPHLDESKFPWRVNKAIQSSLVSPQLLQTQESIDNFSCDIKCTKAALQNSFICPDFPNSEFIPAFMGKAVNFNAILAHLHSSTITEHRTQSIGEGISIHVDTQPEIAKSVRTQGNWLNACLKYNKAILCIFPHRGPGLNTYFQHISSLFSASIPAIHSQIIAYDKAVRKHVGSHRDIQLSDIHKFAAIKMAHIDSFGIGVATPSGGAEKKGRGQSRGGYNTKDTAPCNNWNADCCNIHSGKCRYAHVCSKCGHKH
ncbi:hypothetical protein JAAARDRAFT_133102, partial [Jaapia argillacea MUCL 33604]